MSFLSLYPRQTWISSICLTFCNLMDKNRTSFLICIFLIASKTEHLFICLLSISIWGFCGLLVHILLRLLGVVFIGAVRILGIAILSLLRLLWRFLFSCNHCCLFFVLVCLVGFFWGFFLVFGFFWWLLSFISYLGRSFPVLLNTSYILF